MAQKKKVASVVTSSPAIVRYLAAVDQLEQFQNNGSSSSSKRYTKNVLSLLKDVVQTQTDPSYFDSLVEQLESDDGTFTTLSAMIDKIANDKINFELSHLYEEYTFATAKDASLTDDVRRRRPTQDVPHHHHANDNNNDDSLVYGEIDFDGFRRILSLCHPLESDHDGSAHHNSSDAGGGGVFIDIGSGSGKAVFAARFCGDYDRCVGVELLPNLHQLAVSVKSLYQILYKAKLQAPYRAVEFHCADLFDYDWSDGTVVYVPSLLFDSAMMDGIYTKAKDLRQGAFLISLKKFKQVASSSTTTTTAPTIAEAATAAAEEEVWLEMVQDTVVPMSWGDAAVYLYRRR